MAYKPVKILALEAEATRLERMALKALTRMDEIQTEIDEIMAAREAKKATK